MPASVHCKHQEINKTEGEIERVNMREIIKKKWRGKDCHKMKEFCACTLDKLERNKREQ